MMPACFIYSASYSLKNKTRINSKNCSDMAINWDRFHANGGYYGTLDPAGYDDGEDEEDEDDVEDDDVEE